MPLLAFDHINIHSEDTGRLAKWYEDVLGLRGGPRPDGSGVEGIWLYLGLGDQAILHLVDALYVDPPKRGRGSGAGAYRLPRPHDLLDLLKLKKDGADYDAATLGRRPQPRRTRWLRNRSRQGSTSWPMAKCPNPATQSISRNG